MSETIKHTPKLWSREVSGASNPQDNGRWYLIWCPGCGHGHTIPTPRWGFNGNHDKPTFTPSLLIFTEAPDTKKRHTHCHLNVTDGRIVYHGDSPHAFKGQTIDLPGIPPDYCY